MVRRTASLVIAGALVVGLSACAASDSGPPVLTWYINPDDGGQEAIAGRCTDAAEGEYRLTTSLLPREASAQREQLARRLAANDASIDLMSLDPPFVPEFAEAGWLEEVPDDVADEVTADVVQGALDFSTWRDEIVVAPFWANTQILWYRRSVAEQAGLDPQNEPVTWDQVMDAAAEQDRVIGVQGISAEALTVWVNALVMSAGGEILTNPEADPEDLELGLDTDAGRAAAEIIARIADEGLAGPGFSNLDEGGSNLQFQGDNASFMVNYPFVWAAINAGVEDGTLPADIVDDIGWGLYPQVSEGEDARPPLGGIGIGVGAFTDEPELAYEAVRCITSVENQAFYFATNGNPAAKTEAYEDPDVQDAFPMADVIRQSLEQSGSRPQTPYYNEISSGIQQTWHPPGSVDPDTTPARSTSFITEVLRGERLL